MKNCGSSSVGRASASQAEGREFESRLPLDENGRLGMFKRPFFDHFFILLHRIVWRL